MTAGRWWWIGGVTVALLVLAALLGPRQLGGPVTYVVTTGSSMRPHLDAGDLVLVRDRSAYDIGDVAAYRSPLIDTTVLHRIVARDGDRYVLQGDDNDFLDPDRPRESDLLGTQWLHVPAAGRILTWAKSPAGAGALVAALTVLAGGATTHSQARRRRRRAGGNLMAPRARSARPDRAAASLAAATVVCLALAAGTYVLPPATQPVGSSFTHRGEFGYTAATPANAVYPDGRVVTGDPVFLTLVDRVDVTFAYRFDADRDHTVTGRADMDAVIEGSNGWSSTLPLDAPAPFRGDDADVAATLDLAQVRGRIAEVEELTGLTGGAYTVTVAPRVQVQGRLAGQELDSEFAPQLVFQLDAAQLRPASGVGGEAGAAAPDDATTFQPTEQGTLTTAGAGDGNLALLGRPVPARPLRLGLVVLGLLAAAAAAVLWWPLRRSAAREATRVARRYGQAVIDVDAVDPAAARTQVHVASIDALLRLAERYDRLVLRQQTPTGSVYLVEDDGTVYRHEAHDRRPELAARGSSGTVSAESGPRGPRPTENGGTRSGGGAPLGAPQRR